MYVPKYQKSSPFFRKISEKNPYAILEVKILDTYLENIFEGLSILLRAGRCRSSTSDPVIELGIELTKGADTASVLFLLATFGLLLFKGIGAVITGLLGAAADDDCDTFFAALCKSGKLFGFFRILLLNIPPRLLRDFPDRLLVSSSRPEI